MVAILIFLIFDMMSDHVDITGYAYVTAFMVALVWNLLIAADLRRVGN